MLDSVECGNYVHGVDFCLDHYESNLDCGCSLSVQLVVIDWWYSATGLGLR